MNGQQPNQYTFKQAINKTREWAEAERERIGAEIKALEAEIEKRKCALQQMDATVGTMESEARLPASATRPVRPARAPGSLNSVMLAAKKRAAKKKSANRPAKKTQGEGED